MSDNSIDEAISFDSKFYWGVRRNAKRLIDDARLMKRKKRYASAVATAILGIEELGKALIIKWGVKNQASRRKYPTHVEKQSATFALLSASELIKEDSKRLDLVRKMEIIDFHALGPYSSQFAHARGGFYEDLRKAVIYSDEEPKFDPAKLTPHIDANLVNDIIGFFVRVEKCVGCTPSMDLAATFYSLDLGRM